MSESEIGWDQLEELLARGRAAERSLRGLLRTRGWPNGAESVLRVSQRGARWRRETLDGAPVAICGRDTLWTLKGLGLPMVATPLGQGTTIFNGDRLLGRSGAHPGNAQGPDGTAGTAVRPHGPIRRVEHLGRAAWQVALERDAAAGRRWTEVIDAETGWPLRVSGEGLTEEWLELEVGVDLPDDLFVWDGPTRPDPSLVDDEERDQRQRDAAMASKT